VVHDEEEKEQTHKTMTKEGRSNECQSLQTPDQKTKKIKQSKPNKKDLAREG
jgi:hypothetical protein